MGERIPLALRHGKMLEDLLDVSNSQSCKFRLTYYQQTELTKFDDSVYGTCTYENIYDPAFLQEGGSFDWPGPSASLVEVPSNTQTHDSNNTSGSLSSHIQTPDAGILPDVAGDMGPILSDVPTSASATLEQLLQSMDSDSFLLASGYGDFSQMPLF